VAVLWPRKRPDISYSDLAFGLASSLSPSQGSPPLPVVTDPWIASSEAVVCLSVRSGFDLLLQSLALPVGSEIIVSSVTIPDMLRIIEHHGCVPIPVPVDSETLEPSLQRLERVIGPKTRGILIAHLFGSVVSMGPVVDLARRHDLFVFEDCAQAYSGSEYAGHADSDAAMFSFGPIKTATALGGAVLRVRDIGLRNKMRELQAEYPAQSRLKYGMKIVKHALLKLISTPRVYGSAIGACQLIRIDYDPWIANLARSFPPGQLIENIRQQPSFGLLRLLSRRIRRFDQVNRSRLWRRTRFGRFLIRHTGNLAVMFPGNRNATHSFWVVAVQTLNGATLVKRLQAAGFDATMRSSMCDASTGPSGSPSHKSWLADTVFLPVDPGMTATAARRLCRLLGSEAIAPSSS
jgi:perosamine synthetase